MGSGSEYGTSAPVQVRTCTYAAAALSDITKALMTLQTYLKKLQWKLIASYNLIVYIIIRCSTSNVAEAGLHSESYVILMFLNGGFVAMSNSADCRWWVGTATFPKRWPKPRHSVSELRRCQSILYPHSFMINQLPSEVQALPSYSSSDHKELLRLSEHVDMNPD